MPYTSSPATVAADELKLLVGDLSTSSSGELLKSAECTYFINRFGSAEAAAPHACLAIAAQFADQVSKSVGDLRIDAQQKVEHYLTLAKSLERGLTLGAVPHAGGISQARKQTVESDTDRVVPSFRMGLHDDPGNRSVRSTST
jgi:hypothetical protein